MTMLTEIVSDYHNNNFNSHTCNIKRIVRSMRMGAAVSINHQDVFVLNKVFMRARVMGTNDIRVMEVTTVDNLHSYLDDSLDEKQAEYIANTLFGYGANTEEKCKKKHVDWPSLISLVTHKIQNKYKYKTVEATRIFVESGKVLEFKEAPKGSTFRIKIDHKQPYSIESPMAYDKNADIHCVRIVLNGTLEDTGEKVIIDAVEISAFGDCKGEEITIVGKKQTAA